jgi:alpha-tubulin suppressor-like RCC1 family protein
VYEITKINFDIIDISCGESHNIILKKDYSAYSFGDNSYGQLGISNGYQETHLQYNILNNVSQIATGSYHSLLLTQNSKIFSFGSNEYGQLGLNLSFSLLINITVPTLININSTIIQISCGNFHCLILDNTGIVLSFGNNYVIKY